MINQSTHGTSNRWRLRLAAAACMLPALFLAPTAVACHKGVPHGNETSCAPGDPLPGESYNLAYFADFTITMPEQVFRRTDSSTTGAGDYVAELPMQIVEIATDGLAKDADSKKFAHLCHAMDTAQPSHPEARGPFVGIPSEFSYGWTGDCTGDSCVAHISLTFD